MFQTLVIGFNAFSVLLTKHVLSNHHTRGILLNALFLISTKLRSGTVRLETEKEVVLRFTYGFRGFGPCDWVEAVGCGASANGSLSASDGLSLTNHCRAHCTRDLQPTCVHVLLEYLMLFFSLFLYFPNTRFLHIYAFEIVEGFTNVYWMLVCIVSPEPHEEVRPEFPSVLRLSGHEVHQVKKVGGSGWGCLFFFILQIALLCTSL